jgi:hypothetical protein
MFQLNTFCQTRKRQHRGGKHDLDTQKEVRTIVTAFFIATTTICAIGWLIRYVSCAALIYYIEKNGYKLPDEQEGYECTRFVVKKIFKL